MGIRCNSILGVTTLHCLPVLSEPYLQCSICFPIVGLFAVFTWHFIHNPSSHLLSYIRVSSLSSGSAVVFSLSWRLSWCQVHCKLFSSFFLRPRMYIQGAEGLWLFFSGCRWRGWRGMACKGLPYQVLQKAVKRVFSSRWLCRGVGKEDPRTPSPSSPSTSDQNLLTTI